MKNLKNYFRIAVCTFAIASGAGTFWPRTASAQLGGLGKLFGNASDYVAPDVKTFVEKSNAINDNLATASSLMVIAYASEEKRAQVQSQFDAMKKSTDPKETTALQQKMITSNLAEMNSQTKSADLAETTKALSAEKKQKLAQGVANFLIGALQAAELVPMGEAVISSAAANPIIIPLLLPIKDALPVLASAIQSAAKTMPTLLSALKGANIKVEEVTSSTKPVSIQSLD